LDPKPDALAVVLELCRGSELIATDVIPAANFGFSSFDQMPWLGSWYGGVAQSVPQWLKSNLASDGSPLWLSFGTHPDPSGSQSPSPRIGATQTRPSGYLPGLSWELNLAPPLNRPVLRMQGLPVRPLTQHQTLHIALCCSFSAAKQFQPPAETLRCIFEQIPPFPGQSVTLHVFADESLQSLISDLQPVLPPAARLRIYNPAEAAQYGDAERTRSVPDSVSELQSPWLLWMRDKLSEVGVDAVHFVTHGYLSRGQGALAFAESPIHNDDRHWARFVGTREISMFLDQVGAWSAILTSPLENYSAAGLRVLQDSLTDFVAGPVMLYEMADDPERAGLRPAYEYLFNVSAAEPPVEKSVSFYTHPDWRQPLADDDETPTRGLIQEFTLAGRLQDEFDSPQEVPGWLAAGQRSLERAVAKISLAGTGTDSSIATRQGREEALRLTADLFAKFAKYPTKIVSTKPDVEQI
jgi:hypothetical protein